MPKLHNVSEGLQQKWQQKFENWGLHGLKLINLSEQTDRHLNIASLPGSSFIPNIWFLSMRYKEEAWTLSPFIPGSFVPQELLDIGLPQKWYWELSLIWVKVNISAKRHFNYARSIEDFKWGMSPLLSFFQLINFYFYLTVNLMLR